MDFPTGSQFWLFRDLTLQEGFPQPLSSLRGAAADEEEAAAGRSGLVWDAEEGPVWGHIRDTEETPGDTWSQLLREGVNGMVTESDGGNSNIKH